MGRKLEMEFDNWLKAYENNIYEDKTYKASLQRLNEKIKQEEKNRKVVKI